MYDKLSPPVADILRSQAEQWAQAPERWSLPLPQARQQTLEMNRRWNRSVPEMASIQDLEIANRDGHKNRARLYLPDGADDALIVNFHGGGWVVGDIDTHDGVARQLAKQSGSAVLSCNYRLAPEFPFPAALEDCIDVWRQLSSAELDLGRKVSGPIAFAGDSAGANLALGVMLHELDCNRRVPDFAMLFYGVYGRDFATASYQDYAEGPGITRAELQSFWDWYAPKPSQHTNPLAAPLLASDKVLSRCPPLFLAAAGVDPLISENRSLYERLSGFGRSDTWVEYPGVPHGFIQMNTELPLARQALEDAGNAFRKFKANPI